MKLILIILAAILSIPLLLLTPWSVFLLIGVVMLIMKANGSKNE